MLQMVQRLQRLAYLARQTEFVDVVIIIDVDVCIVAKVKLDDMASSVAALDASPPAAAVAFPCTEEVVRIAGDPLLERKQACPFMWDAAAGGGKDGCDYKNEQLGAGVLHGRMTNSVAVDLWSVELELADLLTAAIY